MTRNNRPPTETVRAISEINLTNGGYSLIPWSWYEYVTITKKNKHGTEIQYPDLLGLSILSHIVFWYTPTITVDEATQKPNPPQRKFGADKLQCGYQELADRFGASKTQVKQAVARLVEAGLITTELRTVRVKGQVLNNVMFVEPVPERVASISLSINQEDPSPSIESTPPPQLTDTNTYTSTYTDIDTAAPNGAGTSPPEKPKTKTPPAVTVFRENAHRYPAKSWYERIANAVGEDPDDLKFWGQVVFDYVGKGWNPTNVLNMLEFYEKGETPGDRRRGESDDRTIMLDDGWQPIEPDFVKPMTTVT